MLSQTAEYALRAVIHIARANGTAPVRVSSIADELSVPQNYLSKVLHALAREGVLHSIRGRHGGFVLAGPADELSLESVVAPFEPPHQHMRCLLRHERCSEESPCIAHEEWKSVSGPMRAFFRSTTVGDLARHAEADAALPV